MQSLILTCAIEDDDSFVIRDGGSEISLEILSDSEGAYVGVSISIHQAKALHSWLSEWISKDSKEADE